MNAPEDKAWGPGAPKIPGRGAIRLAGVLLIVTGLICCAGGAVLVAELGTLDDREGEGDLTGWVKDEEGRDLPGVTVRVGEGSDETDENGRYRIADVPAGVEEVTFEKPGYVTHREEVIIEADATTTLHQWLLGDRDFERWKVGTVNVSVSFTFLSAYVANDTHPPRSYTLRVDGLWFGELYDITPGTPLELEDSPKGRYVMNVTCLDGEHGEPLWWNGTGVLVTDEDQLVELELWRDDRREAESLPGFHTVSGSVSVPEGMGAGGVEVALHWWNGTVNETLTGPGGEFSIGDVPPGKYILRAWAEGLRLYEIRHVMVGEDGTVGKDGEADGTELSIEMSEAAEPTETPLDRNVYEACMGLYILVSIIVIVAGVQAFRGRSFTFCVFGGVLGMSLGLMGSVSTPICFSSILALAALIIILRYRPAFR